MIRDELEADGAYLLAPTRRRFYLSFFPPCSPSPSPAIALEHQRKKGSHSEPTRVVGSSAAQLVARSEGAHAFCEISVVFQSLSIRGVFPDML